MWAVARQATTRIGSYTTSVTANRLTAGNLTNLLKPSEPAGEAHLRQPVADRDGSVDENARCPPAGRARGKVECE